MLKQLKERAALLFAAIERSIGSLQGATYYPLGMRLPCLPACLLNLGSRGLFWMLDAACGLAVHASAAQRWLPEDSRNRWAASLSDLWAAARYCHLAMQVHS